MPGCRLDINPDQLCYVSLYVIIIYMTLYRDVTVY